MNVQKINTFENWFVSQQKKGLIDIKFAVTPGKGVTSAAIKNELLAAEAMIDAGYVKEFAPRATSVIPQEVMNVITAARI